MAESYATAQDVEDQWRPLTPGETTTVGALLGRVSALMRLQVPDLDDRAASSADLSVIARGVAVDAVLRVMRNPDGKSEESIDDYRYRRADAVADGSLYLTTAELALLSPRVGVPRGRAFTVSLWG